MPYGIDLVSEGEELCDEAESRTVGAGVVSAILD